nr:AAA family ATPase [Cyclobacteriaceae bacterium]
METATITNGKPVVAETKADIKTKIKRLLEALNDGVFEKEEAIRLSLLTSIAGESIFFLGLPGVAKSLIARRLKFAFKDAKSFEYLMNRFSTPDEVFGPISVTQLQQDNYMRIVENYLPDAEIVFLDEIWKAGPAIQNTLLTVLNEKVFRNGKEEIKVKLKGLISASNELPADNDGHNDSVEALWDRFLIRLVVGGVEDETNFNSMISDDLKPTVDNIAADLKITDDEYKKWDKEIDAVAIPDEVYKV